MTLCCSLAAQSFPFQDASLSAGESADDVLGRLVVKVRNTGAMGGKSSDAVKDLEIYKKRI